MIFPYGSSYPIVPLQKGEENKCSTIKTVCKLIPEEPLTHSAAEERGSADRASSNSFIIKKFSSELHDLHTYPVLPLYDRPEIFSYEEKISSWLVNSRFICFTDFNAGSYQVDKKFTYHRFYVVQEGLRDGSFHFISGATHNKIKTSFFAHQHHQNNIDTFLLLDENIQYKIPNGNEELQNYLKNLPLNSTPQIITNFLCEFYRYFLQIVQSEKSTSLAGSIHLNYENQIWTMTWGPKKMLSLVFSPDSLTLSPQLEEEQSVISHNDLSITCRYKKEKSYLIFGSSEIPQGIADAPLVDLINELLQPVEKLPPSKIVSELLASLVNYNISECRLVLIPLNKEDQDSFNLEFKESCSKVNSLMQQKLILNNSYYIKKFDVNPRNFYGVSHLHADNAMQDMNTHINEHLNKSAKYSGYSDFSHLWLEKFLKRGGNLNFVGLNSSKLTLSKREEIYVGCSQALNRSPLFAAYLSNKGFIVKGILPGLGMDLFNTSSEAMEIANSMQVRSEEEHEIFRNLFGTSKPEAVNPGCPAAIDQRIFYLQYFKKIAVNAINTNTNVTFLCFGSFFHACLMHLLELGLKNMQQFRVVCISFPDYIIAPAENPVRSKYPHQQVEGGSLAAHRNFIELMEMCVNICD